MAFQTPTRDLSVEDLKARYDVSKQTLYARKNAAQVKAKHVKGRTFFTPEEVWCLDQVALFVEQGWTLAQVEREVREWKSKHPEPAPTPPEPEPQPEVLNTQPQTYTVTGPAAPDSQIEVAANATALAKFAEREEQAHQLARAFTSAVGQALQDTQQVVADPLHTHRLLAEAAREEWVLTATQLGEVCAVGRAAVAHWRPQRVKCGFLLTALSEGLWVVRKATREELLEDQKARARPVPENPNPKGQRKKKPLGADT